LEGTEPEHRTGYNFFSIHLPKEEDIQGEFFLLLRLGPGRHPGMKSIALLPFFLWSVTLSAQLPEDALRLSWNMPNGTAREQAIGGAMGSLGGEISSVYVNPAGTGFYRRGELVISPGFSFFQNHSQYLGASSSASTSAKFGLGVSGFVFCWPGRSGNSQVITLAVNRTADFNSSIYYQGQNNYSSYAEQFAEEFSSSGLSINQAISDPNISYGTRMALYTYLIDTATVNGVSQVIALPLKAGSLNQSNRVIQTGGITEIALGLASSYSGKWYLGGSLGIPLVNYTRQSLYIESDATGNPNNDFAFSQFQQNYSSKGFGLNIKLGGIFRPSSLWRIGLAVHSPTFFYLNDNLSASMVTNTENYTTAPGHQISISSDSLDQATGTSAGQAGYDMISPWRFLLSGSYVFRETVDPSDQRGFVTADFEYQTTNHAHFDASASSGDGQYYSDLNSVIRSYFKGTFAARLGGELKFNTLMARLGVAYYSNPYRQSPLAAQRLYLTGGIGYRNRGIFIDLAYVEGFVRDVDFPYRLADKSNVFSNNRETTGKLVVTVGFKFP
jgi:hypothetical protein